MISLRTTGAAILCCLTSLLWVIDGSAAGEGEFSEAEIRLWMTDHLKSIDRAMEIAYSFEKSGTLEPGFKDSITLTINAVNDDGSKAASVEFFEGERRLPIPDVAHATENPVLEAYLFGDVREMNRLTDQDGRAGERWRYFQRRIRLAAANAAVVEPFEFEFEDQTWNGHRIEFKPYVNDPKRNLFEKFAEKTYTVIACDDLPGYFYRIETQVPGEGGADNTPIVREVVQLVSISRH